MAGSEINPDRTIPAVPNALGRADPHAPEPTQVSPGDARVVDGRRSSGPPSAERLKEGVVFASKYRIGKHLGEGGMGAVYEAVHVDTAKVVALKVITTTTVAAPGTLARFRREARALGAIDTKHIVQVFDVGQDESTRLPFMVMERLTGEDLNRLLRRLGPLPSDLALRISAQVCIGLSKAHGARVVHRDIKPANLYLSSRDDEIVVKILDFGIAKIKREKLDHEEDAQLTRTGALLGSPRYMSPEQALGLKTIDHRTDIWSLGVVLYKMLTGRTPFADVETPGQMLLALCSARPPPVETTASWIEPEVSALVNKALDRDVEGRFQSADEMLEAIRRLLPDEPNLRPEMLVSVPPEQRAQLDRATIEARSATIEARSATTESATLGTDSGLERPVVRRFPRRSLVRLAGATAAMGVLSLLAWRGLAPNEQRVAAGSSEASAGASQSGRGPSSLVVPVGLAASAAPGAPAPSTSSAPDTSARLERTVEVSFAPASAAVDVDGVTTSTRDGKVALTGELGSSHRVRLRVGSRQTETAVVIGDRGAVPAKIRLDPPAAMQPAAAGTGSAPRAPVAPTAGSLQAIDTFD